MKDWKTFTPEELKAIRANPYVKSATEKMIRFTVDFKEKFWHRYKDDCIRPDVIMQEMGFDVSVIGESRIAGIVMHLREQIKRDGEFRDVRKTPDTAKPISEVSAGHVVSRIEHKLAYLEQEMEFIKKNILADNKARRKN